MKLLFENWNKFLNEEEINEVTEDELENIEDILNDLDAEDLSFGNIFGDKMRIIRPMKVQDKNLDALKKLLTQSGYTPDFSTGLASYYSFSLAPMKEGDKPSTIILTPEQQEYLIDDNGEIARLETDTEESFEKRKRKIQKKQVKIGKLLQKGARLYDNAREAWTASDTINPEDFGLSPDGESQDDTENVEKYRVAATELLDKSRKVHQRLFDVFQGDTNRATSAYNIYQKLAEWWNKKSAFYRENPEEATNDAMTNSEYSIIYTRHPLDVMRMSDFDNITSCHTPPSRPSDSGNSYFKCAVAEAHGHGPVAYVVRNEDLNDWITSSAQSFEGYQEFLDFLEEHEEELFMDTERGTGEISPISRVRLKKFINPSLEVSLAVPSTRTYGKRFPHLYKNISNFAKEKQAKEIKRIEDSKDAENPYDDAFEDGKLNLGKWERMGGSYQDGGDYPGEAIHAFLGYTTTGQAHYDNTFEDNLSINGDVRAQWEERVNEIKDQFNRRMDAITITAEVEDDGDNEYYIDVRATLMLSFDESKFKISAFQDKTRLTIDALPEELINYGFDWLDNQAHYTTINKEHPQWADKTRDDVHNAESAVIVEIPIMIEEVNPEGGGYAYNPDNFEEICGKIDEADDQVAGVQEIATSFLKREGIMEGGGLHTLARALEDESWYEWSHEIDDDWAPTSIEVETKVDVNFNDLIKKIPITFDYQPDKSSEVFIMFAGDPLALASKTHGGEDYSFKGFEVRSPEFDTEKMDGFMTLDAVKEYAQWNVANMILRPKSRMLSNVMGGSRKGESTRDYSLEVRRLMREEAEGKEDEFKYPNSSMWVDGPDSEDDYTMKFMLQLNEDTPDEVTENALSIVTETDDEDILKKIFRTAFAKVAKIPGENIQETKSYFKKFNYIG